VVRRVAASPSHVRLVGPASELRRITQVRTLPVSLRGQTAPFTSPALLESMGREVRVAEEGPVTVVVDIGASKRS